jgi:hypothetical protein
VKLELIIISSEQFSPQEAFSWSGGYSVYNATRTTFQLLEFSHGKLNFSFTILHSTPCKQVYIQFYLLRSRGGLRSVEDKKRLFFLKRIKSISAAGVFVTKIYTGVFATKRSRYICDPECCRCICDKDFGRYIKYTEYGRCFLRQRVLQVLVFAAQSAAGVFAARVHRVYLRQRVQRCICDKDYSRYICDEDKRVLQAILRAEGEFATMSAVGMFFTRDIVHMQHRAQHALATKSANVHLRQRGLQDNAGVFVT